MKKSKSLFALLTLLSFSFFIFSCSKDKETTKEKDPAEGLTKLAEGYATGAATKVALYSKETTITSGYTKFFIALYDSASGQRTDDAIIEITPVMDMGTMQHSAPFENPASTTAINHLFPCSVVFVMSSMSGSWTVKINVKNTKMNKEGSFTTAVTVTDPPLSKQKSFTSANDGNKYFISLIEPSNPKTGINDIEIAIYKKHSMMSWPADSSLSVLLAPEMPSMGHGSPNNVNPVHIGNGHYKGKVNFTMTGLWRLNLDFMSGTAVADSAQFFDIQF